MGVKTKSYSGLVIVLVIFFVVPYLRGVYVRNDIKRNTKYAFAKIVKKIGSLKNGSDWYYEFYFNGKFYESHQKDHIDYDINIGDYFLVHFSSKNPNHNEIIYNYKLKENNNDLMDLVWDTIPYNYIKSGKN